MKFNPSDLIALGALTLTIITTIAGALIWYSQGERKKYAAERDFVHLKNNQKSISDGIAHLSDSIEQQLKTIERDILEIKISLGIKNKDDK